MKNKPTHTIVSVSCILLLLAILLAGCGGKSTKQVPCPPIRIGIMIAPDGSTVGTEQKQGYEFALKQINKSGGVQGCPIQLVYENEGQTDDPEIAQVALLSLADEGVVAVIGATSNEATSRAAAITRSLQIPFIIPSVASNDFIQKENQWVFRISASNSVEADVAFNMLKSKMSSDAKIAILFEKTTFGESAAVTAAESAMERNLQIVMYQRFDPSATDFNQQIAQAVELEANAIYLIANQSDTAQALIKSANKSDGSFHIIGAGNGFTAREFLFDDQGKVNKALGTALIVTPWAEDLPWEGITAYKEDFEKFSNRKSAAAVRNVEAYTALTVTAKAIDVTLADEQGGWLEKLASVENLPDFREALSQSLRNNSDSSEMIMGPISFDSAGQNNQQPVLIQCINDQLITVYPSDFAKRSPIFTLGW